MFIFVQNPKNSVKNDIKIEQQCSSVRVALVRGCLVIKIFKIVIQYIVLSFLIIPYILCTTSQYTRLSDSL